MSKQTTVEESRSVVVGSSSDEIVGRLMRVGRHGERFDDKSR